MGETVSLLLISSCCVICHIHSPTRQDAMEVLCYLLILTMLGPFAETRFERPAVEQCVAKSRVGQFAAKDTVPIEASWEDDFSGDWTNRWPLRHISEAEAEKLTYFSRDGETWIRVTYEEGEVRKGLHFRTKMEHRDSIYMEYKLRFAEDFDWVLGGKLPGLAGGQLVVRRAPTGKDGWSIYFMWRGDGKGSAYVYHPDQSRHIADHFRLDNFWFQKGVVQTLATEVVMNTPGEHDGIIRAWLDGVLVVEETNIRFRTVPELQIDSILFHSIFGGSTEDWAPTKDEHIEFGDFKLYEAPPSEGSYPLSPMP